MHIQSPSSNDILCHASRLETCASNDPSGPGKCNDIEADISILSETLEQESSEGQWHGGKFVEEWKYIFTAAQILVVTFVPQNTNIKRFIK